MTALRLSCEHFHDQLSAGLLSLLESEKLANVTIAVDGTFLKAHQMVLSIWSPYFKSLLENNPCKHPIIFMKDVKCHTMQHLLRFMYEGETHIDAEDFETFIDTAHALQIKWLTTINEKIVKDTNCTNTVRHSKSFPSEPHLPIASKSSKRPYSYKYEPITPDPGKIKPVTRVVERLAHEISSNLAEHVAKRPKILDDNVHKHKDHKHEAKTSSSWANINIPLVIENKTSNAVDKIPSQSKELIAPPIALSTVGSASGTENCFFENSLVKIKTREDDESSYQLKLETHEEIIDIDDEGKSDEDDLLERLPDVDQPDSDTFKKEDGEPGMGKVKSENIVGQLLETPEPEQTPEEETSSILLNSLHQCFQENKIFNGRGRRRYQTFKRRVLLVNAGADSYPSSSELNFLKERGLGLSDDPLEIERHAPIHAIRQDIVAIFQPYIRNFLRMVGFKLGRLEKSKRITHLDDLHIQDGFQLENNLKQSKIVVLPLHDFPADFLKVQAT